MKINAYQLEEKDNIVSLIKLQVVQSSIIKTCNNVVLLINQQIQLFVPLPLIMHVILILRQRNVYSMIVKMKKIMFGMIIIYLIIN